MRALIDALRITRDFSFRDERNDLDRFSARGDPIERERGGRKEEKNKMYIYFADFL